MTEKIIYPGFSRTFLSKKFQILPLLTSPSLSLSWFSSIWFAFKIILNSCRFLILKWFQNLPKSRKKGNFLMLWNKHSISFKIPRYELLQQKFNWYSISKRVDTLIAILWRFGQKSGPFLKMVLVDWNQWLGTYTVPWKKTRT